MGEGEGAVCNLQAHALDDGRQLRLRSRPRQRIGQQGGNDAVALIEGDAVAGGGQQKGILPQPGSGIDGRRRAADFFASGRFDEQLPMQIMRPQAGQQGVFSCASLPAAL